MMIEYYWILGVFGCMTLSVSINVLLVLYFRKVLGQLYIASEESSEIFTRIDTFKEHLESVYELPTFYGDATLKGLLEHSKDLSIILQKYEKIYSLTQPDLVEQLELASQEHKEEYEEDNQKKTLQEKI